MSVAEIDKTHYYDFNTQEIPCGENPNKNTNWVANPVLVTCEKCKAAIAAAEKG